MATPRESESYHYDVFLSYSRKGQWPSFVANIFLPAFDHLLSEELGQQIKLFQDTHEIRTGEYVQERLKRELVRSKVMVALWSKLYFSSDWCKIEASFMLSRAESFREKQVTDRLVLPLVIHDGADFPPLLNEIQQQDIRKYANPYLAKDSLRKEELYEVLRSFAEDVADAIRAVPDESFAWPYGDPDRYLAQLDVGSPDQRTVPTLGLNK